MEIDINPYRSLEANIKPIDFEVFCMETLKAYAEKEHLCDFKISHNQKMAVDDGTYQIDVLAEYTALGAKNKVIVECKKQSRSVEREIVAALDRKLQSIGAQKGILISTAGFQKGAVLYAEKHGIALWQVCDNFIRHISATADRDEYFERIKFQLLIEQYLPNHFMMEWDCAADYPYTQIYPTDEMYIEARKKARENYRALPNIYHYLKGLGNVQSSPG